MEKARFIAGKPGIVEFAPMPLIIYYLTALLAMTFLYRAFEIPYRNHMATALAAGTGLRAIPPP
ncbi:conserved hypothetical protein [Thermococcus sp. AM4]|nr:conserved hypothetical protein [Thermococcus sp. AM4]